MIDHVNYDALDHAKGLFIEASKRTLSFASDFGFLPDERLGASANIFELNLKPFLDAKLERMAITLVSEGLGTADDARPSDLTHEESVEFWENIGGKTVAVMTNDVASAGMQPILLSMYLPCANPELVFTPDFLEGFLNGIVKGCQEVGCIYFSGETPQLKSKIFEDKLDIAGAVFGLVPPGSAAVTSNSLQSGDTIVFVESSGPHENGYTSLRGLAAELESGYRTKLSSGVEYWRAINKRSVLYTPLIQDLLRREIPLSNIEPISGHGWQKLMRPAASFRYRIEKVLPYPEIFQFVEEQSGTSRKEMLKIFNCGVGLALFTPGQRYAESIVEHAQALGLNACVAGKVEEAPQREVVVEPLDIVLESDEFQLKK